MAPAIHGISAPAVSHSILPEIESNPMSPVEGDASRYVENASASTIIMGWRLQLVVFAFVACPSRVAARTWWGLYDPLTPACSLCFALFLFTLETTIVATALVTISSDNEEFNSVSWIVLAYLLTYCGFLVIYARLSDIFGRKSTILVALILFTLFSLLCEVAQSMKQL